MDLNDTRRLLRRRSHESTRANIESAVAGSYNRLEGRMSRAPDLTVFLERWRAGDDAAAAELLGAVYKDLQRLAAGYMRRERVSHTLQPTALLHEAWLRLAQANPVGLSNREEF